MSVVMSRCRLFAFALLLMLSAFGADVALCAEVQVAQFKAAELSKGGVNSLPEGDLWVVADSKLSSRDMLELQLLLATAQREGRYISLEFPNLVEFPAMELEAVGLGDVEVAYGGYPVLSVKMPKVVKVGDNAFLGSYRMHTLSIPKATHIGRRAFAGCSGLVRVDAQSVEYYLDDAFYSSKPHSFPIPTQPKTKTQIRLESDAVLEIERAIRAEEPQRVGVSQRIMVAGEGALVVDDKRIREPLTGVEDVVELVLGSVEVIGAETFAECEKLRFLSLATDEGAKVRKIDVAAFGKVKTEEIELTVGLLNKGYVDGDLLTIGRFSRRFKSIKIRL